MRFRWFLSILLFNVLLFFDIYHRIYLPSRESVIISNHGNNAFAEAIQRLLKSHAKFYNSDSSVCQLNEKLKVEEELLLANATQILPLLKSQLSTYPDEYFEGRGIVLTVGQNQLLHTKFNLRIIEWLKTKLPVEVWYSSTQINQETVQDIINFVPQLNLQVCCFETGYCYSLNNQQRNISLQYIHKPSIKQSLRKIYAFKPAAILSSTFREVIFIDSDCYIVKDPIHLFDNDPMYKQFGSLFYPDIYRAHQYSHVWSLLNTTCVQNEFSIDSGVIVLDKKRVWNAIYLVKLMSHYDEIFYRRFFSDGDKDTFKLAFRTMHIPYYIVNIPCSIGYIINTTFCGVTLCKTDSLGLNVYFDHVHHPKHLHDLTFRKENFTHTRIALVDPYDSVSFITGYCGLYSLPCFQIGFYQGEYRTSVNDYCQKSASIYDNKSFVNFLNKETVLWDPNVGKQLLFMQTTDKTIPGYIDFYFQTQNEPIFKDIKL